MDTVQLLQPILDGGLRSINFFNGRLLTGEDLSEEQKNWRSALERLGRALGDGIAYGLEVAISAEPSPPTNQVITVHPGLAINRNGQALVLTKKINLGIVQPSENAAAISDQTASEQCKKAEAKVTVTGKGVYLLTMAPASGTEGRAPVSGLGNVTATCNVRYKIEGVQFRLLPLPLSAEELSDAERLRNRVAYKCFNVSGLTDWITNPFGPTPKHKGLLDELLEARCLTDCQVPLAVLFWSDNRIQFVDMWSVRRRLTAPTVTGDWNWLLSDRWKSEAEAMVLQFQDQIDFMRSAGTDVSKIEATKISHFLPPLGLLPIIDTEAGSPSGFHPQKFFGAKASKDVALIDGNLVRWLVHESIFHDPIDLASNQKIQLYKIFENVKAVEGKQTNQLVLLFASHWLQYKGVARFGYARWNLSRVVPAVI